MFEIIRRKLVGKSAKKGYTMTELLTVVAIIAVICAIAIPSVIAIQRRLTYRQNNEYAKSVYMAAQANLTDMRSKAMLTELQEADGASEVTATICAQLYADGKGPDGKEEYRYTASGTEAFEILLPPTSIDSKVRNADIVIDYNPITGNVYSVFYFHKTDKLDLLALYESGKFTRADRTALADYLRENLIGYYDGSPLVSSKITRLKNNDATLEFVNDEEGVVNITIPINPKYETNPQAFMKGLDVDITVEGQNIAQEDNYGKVEDGGRAGVITVKAKSAGSIPGGLGDSRCVCKTDGKGNVVITYVLDSLYDDKSFANLVYGNTSEYLYQAEKNAATAEVIDLSKYPSADYNTCLTDIHNEDKFRILPGDNVTISAEITFEASGSNPAIKPIATNIEENVNPMFGDLAETDEQVIMRLDNGRNMQNLNAVAPTVAKLVSDVDFGTADGENINWNNTVKYYNNKYKNGGTYSNTYGKTGTNNNQAPARALPYFVPINNENMFGSASFIYPNDNSFGADVLKELALLISEGIGRADSALGRLVDVTRDSSREAVLNAVDQIFDLDKDTPTLSDELETNTAGNAIVNGNGNAVYYLNINTNAYRTCKQTGIDGYYAGCTAGMAPSYTSGGFTSNYKDDSFAGLFGYVNTTIRDLDIVNPKVKGAKFEEADRYMYAQKVSGQTLIFRWEWSFNADVRKDRHRGNNPCAGALAGCCGWNAYLENCGAYIDTKDKAFSWSNMNQTEYKEDASAQTFYGVSGSGAVGGLVGYCKSHAIFSGDVNEFEKENKLAYKECFASVPVSGLMRGADKTSIRDDRYYGYTNGVGGLVGNSQLTSFYNCYSGSTVLADGVYIDSQMWDNGVLNDLLRSWSDNLNNNLALLGDNVLDLSYNGRTSMGAGGLVGTSHGSVYRNCFTASSVDATNTLSSGSDAKKSGCAGFVGVMCYQESFAYGNDKTSEEVTVAADVSQKSMFLNCYSAGLSRIRTSKETGYESVAENFNGANARTKTTTLSDLQEYWNGNFYDVYAPAWFTGKTTRSNNNTEVTRKYAFLNDDINALINPTTNQNIHKGSVVYKTNVNVEDLSKDSYVFKDSYYLSGYNNNVGSDTYSRCGLPILYERLENLTDTHNSESWINGQLSVVKNRTVSTLYNNAIQTNDVYKAFIDNKDNKEEAEEDIKNVDPKLWNFAGIYFGEWLNQRINWSGSDLPRDNATIKVGLTDFITGKVLQEIRSISKGYDNTTYRYEASANAGQGGLIARFIINEYASPDKRLDPDYVNQGKTSSIGGGYIAFAADNMDDHTFTIKANTWDTKYTIDKHDHAYWNYHEHFHNRLGDLEYIYKALYKMGYPAEEWTTATASSTHSYEQSAQNAVYPFSVMTSFKGSGIANDFYGTWVTKPLACGLAYYEKYDDGTPEGTYGYYYDSLGTSTLRNDLPVVSDGYAILTANGSDGVKITETTTAKVYGEEEISYNVNDGADSGVGSDKEVSFEYITGSQAYAVHFLPWEAIEACANNSENYYSKLTVRVKVEAKDESGKSIDVSQLGIKASDIDSEGYVTFTMYFNPNAAISQINPAVGGSVLNLNAENPVETFGGHGPKDNTILLRTARQFAAMNNLSNYWYDGIKYEQQLDINGSDYTGESYGSNADKAKAAANAITPIGSSSNPFNASYNGYGGYTDKAQLGGWGNTCSYFGYVGGSGKIENLVLNCGSTYGSGSDAYIAVLAAENHGNINNVEARMTSDITLNAATGAGVIAGYNCGGVIENCDVNLPTETDEDGNPVINRFNVSSTASNVGAIAGCSDEAGISGGSVTLGSVSGGSSVGGVVGSVIGAVNNSISGITVDVNDASGDSVGGIVGSVSKATISDVDVAVNGKIAGGSYAGGAIGVNSSESTVTNVKLTIGEGVEINASTAGGFIGDGAYVTVKNLSQLAMNGSVNGTDFAGGFAGKLTGGEIDGFTLELKGNVSSASGDAAGFAAVIKGASVTSSGIYNYGKTVSGANRAAGFAAYLDGTDSECFVTGCNVTGPMTVTSANGDAAGFIVSAEAANNRRVNIETCNLLPVRADAENLEEEYLKLGATGYDQIKVNGAKNSAGFIVDCKGAKVDGCDTVCSVGCSSSGNAAGFAVNVDSAASVLRCISNTKVKGSAFIANNAGTVTNSYAWFGKEGTYDAETNGYTSCYIAPRQVPSNEKLADVKLQLFNNKGKASMRDLADISTADLNGRRDDGTEKGEWRAADSFTKYPFNRINPPQYQYPMLREHYGDWLNPPQYSYGIAYYEKLANGKTVVKLWDMQDVNLNIGLMDIASDTGYFSLDTLNLDEYHSEKAVQAGYMVFYGDASAVTDISFKGESVLSNCTPVDDKFLNSIDFTGLAFNPASGDKVDITDDLLVKFKERYTFAFINETTNFVDKSFNNDETPVAQELVITGLNIEHPSYTVMPGFAADVRETGTAHGTQYLIRTGYQFRNIGSAYKSDGSNNFVQQRNIELQNNVNVGYGSFAGIYSAKDNDSRFAIKLNNVNAGIFRNVSGNSKISDVELYGGTANMNIGGNNNFGLLANTCSGTIENVSMHDCTINFGHKDNNSADVRFAALVGHIGGGTVRNCAVNNVKFESKNDGGTEGVIYVGAVAGDSSAKLENVAVTNCSISYESNNSNKTVYFGGVTGQLLGGSMSGVSVSNNAVTLKGDAGTVYAGGAIGEAKADVTVTDATDIALSVNTSGTTYAGGVVGYTSGAVKVNGAASTKGFELNNTAGTDKAVYTGGIAGRAGNVEVGDVNNEGFTVKTNGNIYIGGVVGEGTGNVTAGTVSGNSFKLNESLFGNGNADDIYAGGIAGKANGVSCTAVENGSFSMEADGNVYTGGVVGKAGTGAVQVGNVSCSDSSESINVKTAGEIYAGGVAGSADGAVKVTGDVDIKNFKLNDTEAKDKNIHVGGIAGKAGDVEAGDITSAEFKVKTNGDIYIGGVVGEGTGNVKVGTVSGNSFNINESLFGNGKAGSIYVGGVAGTANGVSCKAVVNGSFKLESNADAFVGGVVGNNTGTGEIKSSETNGKLNVTDDKITVTAKGNAYVGGAAGATNGNVTLNSVKTDDGDPVEIKVNAGGIAWVGGVVGGVGKDANVRVSEAITPSVEVKGTESNNAYVGGAVGYAAGGNTISCDVNSPDIATTANNIVHSGGIAGLVNNEGSKAGTISGTVTGASITSTVTAGYTTAGGAVGEVNNCNVTNTTVNGVTFDVSANNQDICAGGLVGRAVDGSVSGTVTDPQITKLKAVEAFHTVDDKPYGVDVYLGGAVGCAEGCSVDNCTVDLENKSFTYDASANSSKANALFAGGIVGKSNAEVNNSSVTVTNGSISFSGAELLTEFYAGGAVGYGGSVTNCTVTADNGVNITAYAKDSTAAVYAGGAVGKATGAVNNCDVKVGTMKSDKTVDKASNITVQTVNSKKNGYDFYAGGAVGECDAAVNNCDVVITGLMKGGLGTASSADDLYVGGVAGKASSANNDTFKAYGGTTEFTAYQSTAANFYAGGIVGNANGAVDNCKVNATNIRVVSGGTSTSLYAGGAAGNCASVNNSDVVLSDTLDLSATAVTASNVYLGGIVGKASGEVTDSDITAKMIKAEPAGAAAANIYMGGVAGNCGNITRCTATATDGISLTDSANNSTGTTYAGGVVGNAGTVTDCKATGAVTIGNANKTTKDFYAGGIAGKASALSSADSDVSASIALTKVSNAAYVGGAVGNSSGAVNVKSVTTNGISVTDSAGEIYAGGVAGKASGAVTANGTVTTNGFVLNNSTGTNKPIYVGGVAGNSGAITLTNESVTNNGAFTIDSAGLIYAGGAAGNTSGGVSVVTSGKNITNSAAFTLNTGKDVYVGGAAGYSGGKLGTKNVYNRAAINVGTESNRSGLVYAGGIAGKLVTSNADGVTGQVHSPEITVYSTEIICVGGAVGEANSNVSVDAVNSPIITADSTKIVEAGGAVGSLAGTYDNKNHNCRVSNASIDAFSSDYWVDAGGAVGLQNSGLTKVSVSGTDIKAATGGNTVTEIRKVVEKAEDGTETEVEKREERVYGDTHIGGIVGRAVGGAVEGSSSNTSFNITPNTTDNGTETEANVGGAIGLMDSGVTVGIGNISAPNIRVGDIDASGKLTQGKTYVNAGGAIGQALAAVSCGTVTDPIVEVNCEYYAYVGGAIGKATGAVTSTGVSYTGTETEFKVTTNGRAFTGGVAGYSTAAVTVNGSVTNGKFDVEANNKILVGGIVGDTQNNVTVTGTVTNSGEFKLNNKNHRGGESIDVGGVAGRARNVTAQSTVTNGAFDLDSRGNIFAGGAAGDPSGVVTVIGKVTNNGVISADNRASTSGNNFLCVGGVSGMAGGNVTAAAVENKAAFDLDSYGEIYAGGVLGVSAVVKDGAVDIKSGTVTANDTVTTTGISADNKTGTSNVKNAFVGGVVGNTNGLVSAAAVTNNGIIDVDSNGEVCVGGVGGSVCGTNVTGTVLNNKIDTNSNASARVGGAVGNSESAPVTVANIAGITNNKEVISVTTNGAALVGGIAGRLGGWVNTTITAGKAVKPDITVTSGGEACVGGVIGHAAAFNNVSGAVTDAVLNVNTRVSTNAYVGGAVGRLANELLDREDYSLSTSDVNCTVTNCTVKSDTNKFNKISAGGSVGELVEGSVKGSVTNPTFDLSKADGTATANIGGVVGMTGRLKADGTAEKERITNISAAKISGNMNVTAGSKAISDFNIGGVVGKNNGTAITMSSSTVNLSYTPSSEAETVRIGGIVGSMNGGSIGDATKTAAEEYISEGSITLNGTKNSNSSYVIGGAVGKEDNSKATYSNVKVNVAVDAKWGNVTVKQDIHTSPAGRGKVGQFIGYVIDGKFTSCYGTGGSNDANYKYQFLGEIAPVPHTVSVSGMYVAKNSSGVVQGLDGTITATSNTDGGTPVYNGISFTPATSANATYYSYDAKLTDCHYTLEGADKLQIVDIDNYLYNSIEYNEKIVNSKLIKVKTASDFVAGAKYFISNDTASSNDTSNDIYYVLTYDTKATRDLGTKAAILTDNSVFDPSIYEAYKSSIWTIGKISSSYSDYSDICNVSKTSKHLNYLAGGALDTSCAFRLEDSGNVAMSFKDGKVAIYHQFKAWGNNYAGNLIIKSKGIDHTNKGGGNNWSDSYATYDKLLWRIADEPYYRSQFSLNNDYTCYCIR